VIFKDTSEFCPFVHEKEEGMLSSFEELGLNWLAHVVDEKPAPPFKIDILWAMGDSIPDLVPTRFLLGPTQN